MQQLSSSAAGTPVTRALRPLHAALAALSLIVAAAGLTSACSEGEKCVGGVVIDGVCEAECEPELCKEGNTCVGNRCMLVCDSHQDCDTDAQDCVAAVEDKTGAELFVCDRSEKTLGFGHSCPFGVECQAFGVCADGESRCSLAECGGNPDTCAPDPAACGDQLEGCTAGKCPDGTGCLVSACSAAECSAPLSCLSAGPGDADAYCTSHGCQADADCAAGYFCGITRDPREICGTPKGNDAFCGETTAPCVEPAQLAAEGLFEGSRCALRNTCLKRTQCSPCEADLDCSTVEGQRCVALAGGEKVCARTCNADADCDPDYACTANACTPRFGACRGQGNFCDPCQNDTDCGGPESTKACASLSGNQRACFDFSFPDTCTTDADCPASQSGRRGECLDEGEGVAPTDSVYHRCYFPYDAPDNKFGCW